ncbi:Gfo/Idh/MocA family oxidoreductase [Candidatus Poribacteria bacterium]|jgi:1,5-anhydro-D-fructose reductase (1,5-anhydro-D-mannitol-forming)|nr:Gfo/Idh/MocA family oxidoreductase [Candidatus Poribacteria bacterium]MBT5531699.1 Gfo/Idh/MocA family oxidoreductase [Candidatus Poribacteria bacterium]MBT5711511.1 Gfo/Idh/MocA family oxidoreductase [Candidatus Poribacteria bacterium]MBT7096815.1 Gfo/Idh/MocA family oxidoreductase [Candidatus Poribacteria bacterium]MBT7804957.1 Gfo/Idh/MocA family oxidoreductase [Candidatus Poribacteria bacterium]
MTLRWGILGCGDVAERKGGPPLYQEEGSDLVAVMRRDAAKAEDFAERHGAKRAYSEVDDLLSDTEINAVYVATTPDVHCEQTIRAADAGLHVLCEKPMAMNVDECRRMIEACERNNVVLMVAYYRRLYPNMLKLKQLLDDGAIGQVILARVNQTGYYNPEPGTDGTWRTDPTLSGGGVLAETGCHRIDLLGCLLGDIESARGYAAKVHWDYLGDDSSAFALRFASGAHATLNINWNIGVGVDDIEIYGTEGALRAVGLDSGALTLEKGGSVTDLRQPRLPFTHTGLVRNFVAHLRTGEPICCTGRDALQTAQAIEDIYAQD